MEEEILSPGGGLSRLEEDISSLDYKVGYSNLTKGERDAVHSLIIRSIINKQADKGSAVVVWDREDCLEEAKNQLDDNLFFFYNNTYK